MRDAIDIKEFALVAIFEKETESALMNNFQVWSRGSTQGNIENQGCKVVKAKKKRKRDAAHHRMK